MTGKIADDVKSTVIRYYLQGLSRNDVARTCGLGEGTVSNIVDDWKQGLSYPDAECLRELAINLRRLKIDGSQCAEGFMILMLMRKLGVAQNEFESFMSKVYGYYQRNGQTPDTIAPTLESLADFSKQRDIPFAKIPAYIEERKIEETNLEQHIQDLQKQRDNAEMEKSNAEELRDAALQDEQATATEIISYKNLKAELAKYGLLIEEDIPKFVQPLYGIKLHGYSVGDVLSKYSDLEYMEMKQDMLFSQIKKLEIEKMRIENNCYFLQQKQDLHNQRLSVYYELERIGFGLNELRILYNTIRELAAENKISSAAAIQGFFEFLVQLYGVRLLWQKYPPHRSDINTTNNLSFSYRLTDISNHNGNSPLSDQRLQRPL